MNLRGTFFTVSSLVIVAFILTAEVFFYMSVKKLPEKYGLKAVEKKTDEYKLVKAFHFMSEDSLDEWDEKVLSGKRTDYKVTEIDGKNCVKAYSDDSASALFYRERFAWKEEPVLSWEWKAEKFPARNDEENLNKKKEFDFVAQVYVIFHARFFLNSKAIQYVWTENLPVGEVSDSPYTGNVRLLVLESGPTEEWKREERDLGEDFLKLFGEPLNKEIEAIAFMTDADSTGTDAFAYFSNIKLAYRGEGKASSRKGFKEMWRAWISKIPDVEKVKGWMRKKEKGEKSPDLEPQNKWVKKKRSGGEEVSEPQTPDPELIMNEQKKE